jgi:CRISPR-associated protein Cas1
MLNEFVYCPRLFYYEFVESVFVESGDTVRGKALHRRVDSGKGDLPPAAEKKSEDRGQRTEDGIAAPSTLNSQPSTDCRCPPKLICWPVGSSPPRRRITRAIAGS